MSALPDLPGGDEPPSVSALAERLASLVPGDTAYGVLAERILPAALSGLADHPRPRRLAEVVYEDLGARLAASDDPATEVERMAVEADIRSLAAHAQSLAVARYVSDDPNAASRAGAFLDADAEQWRGRGDEAIATEAEATREALEAWAERAREEDVFEAHRIDYVHAKLALGSASTGAFGTAAGPLYDFLQLVGTARERLDIH